TLGSGRLIRVFRDIGHIFSSLYPSLAVFLSRFAPPKGFVALRQTLVRRCHLATEPRGPNISEPPRFKTLIYRKGFGAGACGGHGLNEQIFGADEQVPGRGPSD